MVTRRKKRFGTLRGGLGHRRSRFKCAFRRGIRRSGSFGPTRRDSASSKNRFRTTLGDGAHRSAAFRTLPIDEPSPRSAPKDGLERNEDRRFRTALGEPVDVSAYATKNRV